jgi:hypothetical protein
MVVDEDEEASQPADELCKFIEVVQFFETVEVFSWVGIEVK